MRNLVLMTFPLALVVACTDPTGPEVILDLRTDQSSYQEGDTIVVILRNRSDDSASHNLCFSNIERREGDSWVQDSLHAPGGGCLSFLAGLGPGREATWGFPVGDWLEPGTYRISTSVEHPSGPPPSKRILVTTLGFEVGSSVP